MGRQTNTSTMYFAYGKLAILDRSLCLSPAEKMSERGFEILFLVNGAVGQIIQIKAVC